MVRSLKISVNIEEELKQRGIEIISLTEPIDSDTPLGQSFRGMLYIVNQMYSLQRSSGRSFTLNRFTLNIFYRVLYFAVDVAMG
ncbi:MAG: recombinase family protein [Candidatus Poribacteria bacterium]